MVATPHEWYARRSHSGKECWPRSSGAARLSSGRVMLRRHIDPFAREGQRRLFIILVFATEFLGCPYQKLSWPPTCEVSGTPCPLRPGSHLGSRASFHRKLGFA